MPAKSIVHKHTRGPDGTGLHTIRGATSQYTQILIAHGCVWQGKALEWHYTGDALPPVVQDIVDGLYGVRDLAEVVEAPVVAATPATVAPPQENNLVPALKLLSEDARPPRIKGIKKGGTIYAAEDIHFADKTFIPRGCKGKVETQGEGGLNVKFDGHPHFVLCLWNMVTTTPPEQVVENAPPSNAASPNSSDLQQTAPEAIEPPKTPEIASEGYQRIKVRLKGDGGWSSVSALTFGQLCVHRSLDRKNSWSITHIASGGLIYDSNLIQSNVTSLAKALDESFNFDGWFEHSIDIPDENEAFKKSVREFIENWETNQVADHVKALTAAIPDSPIGETSPDTATVELLEAMVEAVQA